MAVKCSTKTASTSQATEGASGLGHVAGVIGVTKPRNGDGGSRLCWLRPTGGHGRVFVEIQDKGKQHQEQTKSTRYCANDDVRSSLFIHERCGRLIETLPALQHDPHRPEDVLKVDADEDGVGGDDAADCLRYLLATKTREIKVRKLKGM